MAASGRIRSPYAETHRILLLHDAGLQVAGPCDTLPVSDFTLSVLNKYDIVVNSSPCYPGLWDREFEASNKILSALYSRRYWDKPVFVVVREAANLLYSRIKIAKSQLDAKAFAAYLIRESRHCGLAMGLDSLKYTSVDIDIRVLADYLLIKSQGITGLPDSLHWVY